MPEAELQLRAVLSERDSLRAEILQKFQNHLQIYALLTPFLAAAIGLAVANNAGDVLLLLPLVSTTFALRYLWEEEVVNSIGRYLSAMERGKLVDLLGIRAVRTGDEVADPASIDSWRHRRARRSFDKVAEEEALKYWIGWEQYFHAPFPTAYYSVSALLTFVVLPILPPIIFSILKLFKNNVNSELPSAIHVVALVVNALLAVYLIYSLSQVGGPVRRQRGQDTGRGSQAPGPLP